MRALVLESKRNLALRDIPFCEDLAPTDVRITPKKVGICGSDVHYYLHGRIGDFILHDPMVVGHEASGVVTEVGDAVSHLAVGDRVCMEPGIPDFTSSQSLEGRYNLDPHVSFWATPPVHGCARESVVHPSRLTFKLPDNLTLEEGALVEPVAIGIYASEKACIAPGDVALVLGAGPIGIVTALAALASGCSKVILADIKERKLRFVQEAYGEKILCINSTKQDLRETIAKESPGGVHVLFEASGSPSSIVRMPEYLRPGGRAVMIGMPANPTPIDIVALQCKEISVHTIFRYANTFPTTLRMISSGSLVIKPLVTHRFSFHDGIMAFQFASDMPEDAVKIMLEMD